MMRPTLLRLAAAWAALALLAIAPSAHAWEPLDDCEPTWTTTPTPYHVNSAGYSQIPLSTIRSIFEDAFDEWARPCCSGFSAVEQGLTDRVGEDASAGQNIFSFRETSWPAELGDPNSVLAVTLTRYQPLFGGGCRDLTADMVFNAANNTFATSEGRGVIDLASVTTHEAGHWLGLDHSRVNAATMWFSYIGESARTLHPDDEAGVCSLYPDTCDCATAADCDPGEACIDNVCIEAPCETNADCADGLECNFATGDCVVPPCRSDADCPGAQICDDATGECVIEADCPTCLSCESDEDCGGRPWQCVSDGVSGFCTRVCASPEECPGNSGCFTVVGEGFAVCLNEGAATAVCPDDYVCIENEPIDLCEDVVCDVGETCDPATGDCVGGGPVDDCIICDDCVTDTDCPGGTCWGFGDRSFCSQDCTSDTDCPPSAECAGFSLQGGGTVQICVNADSETLGVCPSDYVCETVEPTDPCEGVVCDSGEVCDEATGECVPDPEAPVSRGGVCDVCDPCRDDSDCEGACLVLGDAGALCTLPCGPDGACPFNTRCFDLPDGEGGTLSLCLNDTASGQNVCQSDWVCEEVEPGADTGQPDAGTPDATPDTGTSAPPEWFGEVGTGDGGCAAAGHTPPAWPWLFAAAIALRRRRRRSER